MTISERLAMLLKQKGVTQKAIANALNLTPSTVNTWIKSNSDNIPSSYIAPICEFLNISTQELLTGIPAGAVVEVVPDGYILLDAQEKRLINIFRDLPWDSQIVVLNTAIAEQRSNSAQGNNGHGESSQIVG